MLLKSLLFALLLSGAAADADDEAPTLIPPPLPRLRGTAQRNSSDVNGTGHESASPDDIIERAAVSNQFNPGPRPGASRNFVAASRKKMNQNPDPDSTTHEYLHHRPASSKCPKPYTQSGPFCCFGPPMAPECYKWSD